MSHEDLIKKLDSLPIPSILAAQEVPKMPPYLVVRPGSSNNFFADNRVFLANGTTDLELYTSQKDAEKERLVEDFLAKEGLPWEKDELRLDESRYLKVYTVSVN